jgi:hypothetical protein
MGSISSQPLFKPARNHHEVGDPRYRGSSSTSQDARIGPIEQLRCGGLGGGLCAFWRKVSSCSLPEIGDPRRDHRALRQIELTPLEKGMHALRSKMDVKAYAASVGRKAPTVYDEVHAAKVADACADIRAKLSDYFSQLVAIHAARPWLWPALVKAMLPPAGENGGCDAQDVCSPNLGTPPAGTAAVATSIVQTWTMADSLDAAASRHRGGCDKSIREGTLPRLTSIVIDNQPQPRLVADDRRGEEIAARLHGQRPRRRVDAGLRLLLRHGGSVIFGELLARQDASGN